MKKIYLAASILILHALVCEVNAQSSVVIGGNTPDPAAVLMLLGDNSQGLIIPITSNIAGVPKKTGMIVFNSADSKVYYCDGTNWAPISGGVNGTDSQTLTVNGNTISISNGNSVGISQPVPSTNGQVLFWDGSKWTATSATTPTPNQVLTWNGSTWAPATIATGGTVTNVTGIAPISVATGTTTPAVSISAGGITNALLATNSVTSTNIIDATITAADLSSMGAANSGQVLQWNGTAWAAATLTSGGDMTKITYDANNDNIVDAAALLTTTLPITGGGTGATTAAAARTNLGLGALSTLSSVTSAEITDATIAAADLSSMSATSGQVLQFNGTAWVPATLASATFGNLTTTTTGVNIVGGTGAVAGAGVTLNIQNATTAQPGLLTAADFTTFSNKGDMLKSAYDINNDGVVDAAASVNLGSQAANTILAAPNGSAGTPTFRSMVAADLPNIDVSKLTTGTLGVARGGTGLGTTPTNGQILIGNGTGYALSTLTQGTGITITNGAGTVTIASTGLTNPMTTAGDIIYGSAGGAATRLATGSGFLKGGATPIYSAVDLATADVTGTLPLTSGGTGATTAAGAITNLGLGTLSTLSAVTTAEITDGTITATDISSMSATNGQVLKYNGAIWAPAADDVGGGATPTLNSGQILIGDGVNNAAAALAGDATLSGGTLTLTNSAATRTNLGLGSLATLSAVTNAEITDGSITGADIAASTITTDRIVPGTNGQVLTTSAGVATWTAGFSNPMTTAGDIIYGSAGGTATRLATGTGFLRGGATPAYSAINLATTDVSGILPVANGGTGASTLTGVLIGNGTTPLTAVVHTTGNQYLRRNPSNTAYEFVGLTITSSDISDGAIVAADLAGGSVDSNKILDGTIAAIDIADGAISGGTGGKIADGTIVNDDVAAAAAIAVSKLAPGTAGQVLTTVGTTPTWTPFSGLSSSLPIGQMFVGDATNTAVAAPLTGDATLNFNLGNAILTIGTDAINTAKILDGTIADIDVSAAAAINGTKINPTFGTQNISTTGTLNSGAITTTNLASINAVTYTWPNAQGAASTVLTNNGSGTLSWSPVPNTGWSLTGNAGTNPVSDYIGTSDPTNLSIRTNATERMLITSTGNIGIGTATASEKFSVVGGNIHLDGNQSIGLTPSTLNFVTPSGNFPEYGLGWMSDPWQGSGATAYLSGWGGLKLFTGNSAISRIAVEVGGNVGINNDLPQEIFDVNGPVRLQQGAAPGTIADRLYNVGGSLFWNGTNISSGGTGWSLIGNAGTNPATDFIGTTDAQPLRFSTNSIERFRIDATGNIGIGVTTPLSLFDVRGPENSSIDLSNVSNTIKLRSSVNSANGAEFGTVTNHRLNIFTNNTLRLSIAADGNTGFGTTNPLTDIQIGNTSHLFDFTGATGLSYNIYENAGNLFHTTTEGASVLALESSKAGLYINSSATANTSFGSSMINRMVLTETGLSVNKDSPDNSAVLHVVSETTGGGGIPRGFMMPSLITSDRDAIPSPLAGLMIYNQSDNQFNYYNGSTWQALGGGGSGWSLTGNSLAGTEFIGSTNAQPLIFKMNNQPAGRIDNLNASTYFGALAGQNNNGSQNAAFGQQALRDNNGGGTNAAFGQLALAANTTGNYNVAMGSLAMSSNTTGGNNIAVGVQANNNNTIGSGNVAVGYNANFSNSSSANNAAMGMDALFNNMGAGNTAVGYQALFNNTTGSNNTALGNGADVSSGALTNATAIGYNARVNASNSLVLGGTGADAVNVGIGTVAPVSAFEVSGLSPEVTLRTTGSGTSEQAYYRIVNNVGTNLGWMGDTGSGNYLEIGSPNNIMFNSNFGYRFAIGTSGEFLANNASTPGTAGQVLTSAGGGAPAYWGSGSGWGLTGNGGTIDGTNFIGTTDNVPLSFRVFNVNALQLKTNGTVVFGAQNPTGDNNFVYLGGNNTMTGIRNVIMGDQAAPNLTTGSNGVILGYGAGYNMSSGLYNVTIGDNAGSSIDVGSSNVAVGRGADISTSTTSSIAIGHGALVNNGVDNAIAIGKGASTFTSNTMVLGGTGANAVNVGIGTSTPIAKLDVVGGDINTSGEINRASTGAANMVPIAYGFVSAGGGLQSGTSNLSAANTSSGTYSVSVSGESINTSNYVAIVTPSNGGGTPVTSSIQADGTNFNVYLRDVSGGGSGTLTNFDFYVVIYKY